MSKHLVFVYGTLRRGGGREMTERFPGAEFIGDAEVCGTLYDLGAYPGALLDGSDSKVVGEVYAVDDETLSDLDEFEATANYRRRRVDISLGDGRGAGWVYEPDPGFYSFDTLIESGDWVEYAKTKTDRRGGARPGDT